MTDEPPISMEPETRGSGQAATGLLEYVTEHAVDEDYARVSRDRGVTRTQRPGLGSAGMVVVALFGLLLVVAGVQTARNASTDQSGREDLITQTDARRQHLDDRQDRITMLRHQNDTLSSRLLTATAQGRSLSARLSRLTVLTGSAAVTGSGVKVVVDDAPNAKSAREQVLDRDLQRLVNALWAAGAEAISINGQRLTNLTSIRRAGQAITVNYPLQRPYTVLAVGNPDTMPARFAETEHGADWLDLHRTFGIQFTMTSEEALSLPAAPEFNLRYAETPQDEGQR